MNRQPFRHEHRRRGHGRRIPLAAILLLLGAFPCTLPAEPENGRQNGSHVIKIPYSLNWGDSEEKIREMIHAVKARETGCSEKSPGRVVIEAEGVEVGNPLLRKSRFHFKEGSLVEVELQYSDPAWDAERETDFFDRTRRRIDERYGAGSLIVNQVKERPPGEKMPEETTYTLIIYRWGQPAVALELNNYCVEGNAQSYRMVSLHYKTP
jgi:hypothetical protein